ncbi:hypothetical protein MMC09_004636 [Bachmanniomyces sp. S44760]|nr:hypothetical protein [Bachmanniomyces sp. S44760]
MLLQPLLPFVLVASLTSALPIPSSARASFRARSSSGASNSDAPAALPPSANPLLAKSLDNLIPRFVLNANSRFSEKDASRVARSTPSNEEWYKRSPVAEPEANAEPEPVPIGCAELAARGPSGRARSAAVGPGGKVCTGHEPMKAGKRDSEPTDLAAEQRRSLLGEYLRLGSKKGLSF